jgi:hypothetical protein
VIYVASTGQAADLHDRFPSLIKLVLASEAEVQTCVEFDNEEHAIILDEEDITLGGRVIGYQFDRLTGSGTVRISNEDLEKRKIDAFSRQWETEFRIRPYGFQSLHPKSSLGDDAFISDARVTCVRQATDDSEGIPVRVQSYVASPIDRLILMVNAMSEPSSMWQMVCGTSSA